MPKRSGAHTLNRLTALAVTKQKQAGMYADGGGLYLQVVDTGAKSWLFRYMIQGKARVMGLGPVSDVSLEQARKLALDARGVLRSGLDPLEHRAAKRATERDKVGAITGNAGKTFKWCAETYVDTVKVPELSNPKHAAQWGSTLRTYVFPKIGDRVVGSITMQDVHDVLEPIWLTKTETATRVRQRIESVMDWAKVKEYRTGENPARWKGALEHLLAKPSKVREEGHHPSLPYAQAPSFMSHLMHREGSSRHALEFLILTVQRTNPILMAEWSEIDEKAKVWTSPADKMKGQYPHRVPLSDEALAVLEVRKKFRDGPYIFQHLGKPMSAASMLVVVAKMCAIGPAWVDPRQGDRRVVPHGFRSTFRDWAAEVAEAEHVVCEMCLAHAEGNKTVSAYLRGDMLERRRPLMKKWASYVYSEIRKPF